MEGMFMSRLCRNTSVVSDQVQDTVINIFFFYLGPSHTGKHVFCMAWFKTCLVTGIWKRMAANVQLWHFRCAWWVTNISRLEPLLSGASLKESSNLGHRMTPCRRCCPSCTHLFDGSASLSAENTLRCLGHKWCFLFTFTRPNFAFNISD